MQKPHTHITIAYGDGIGPEIMEAVLKIFQAAKIALSVDYISIGEEAYRAELPDGIPLDSWDAIKNNKILLKAPITTPQGKGYKSINVTLRNKLKLYANIRPVISYAPFIKCNFPNMNLVIVRENEEDLYSGIEYRQSNNYQKSLKVITHSNSARIIKYAFDYAASHDRKKVTCMIKDNIMKITDGAFHKNFKEIAQNYKNINNNQMIVDIGAGKLASNPELFDVIVTENLYGDILSDIAAEISGSLGLCGSANLGDEYAMFEAIHGSAPDIAGKNIANPSGLINASIMMLKHIKQDEKAALIANALNATLESGVHTADLFDSNSTYSKEKVSTSEFTQAVIENLGKKPRSLAKFSANEANLDITNKNFKFKLPDQEKTLIGADITIDNKQSHKILDVIEIIKKATEKTSLKLEKIIVKGLSIWPSVAVITNENYDIYSCRFSLKPYNNNEENSINKISEFIIPPQEIVNLIKALIENNLDFINVENLYLFDKETGFSKF
jgi:isocitrate dehydrogenase